MKRLLTLLLAAAMTLSLLAGCGSSNQNNGGNSGNGGGNAGSGDSDTGGEKEWKIGLVAAGTFGDNGLNDALKTAMDTFTENTGIEVTCVEVNEFNDHEIHARNFGSEGYDLVIMGGTVSEIMPTILEDYPDTHYVLNKGTVDGYDNCTSIQFEEPQAGFIGGAFAVMMSEYLGGPSEVGWVGGQRIADLELCRYCFEAGAAYAGGHATTAYVGDFTDIARASELALQMYNDGMVIVQAFAGGAANGVYQAVEGLEEGKYAMGAATGQFDLSPDRIIASHIIKTDEYFADVCQQFIDGELPSGIVKAGLADGATGIRLSPYIGDLIPQEILDAMEEIEAKIISGEIVPPTTEEELENYLASLEA